MKSGTVAFSAMIHFPEDERIPQEYRNKTLKVSLNGRTLCIDGKPLHGYALEIAKNYYDVGDFL